jgi:hypothetical protein
MFGDVLVLFRQRERDGEIKNPHASQFAKRGFWISAIQITALESEPQSPLFPP